MAWVEVDVGEGAIVLVGVGRSGSTILHRLLSQNDHLAWLTFVADAFPKWPRINGLVMRAIDAPVLGQWLGSKLSPDECYRFWEEVVPGFSEPKRDLFASDLGSARANAVVRAFGMCTTKRRTRMLIKVTGWPRVGLLNAAFPDAHFVHVTRNPIRVVDSLLKAKWWDGAKGPDEWRYGPLSAVDMEDWVSAEKTQAALAAIQWRIQVRAASEAFAALAPSAVVQLRYEDLTTDTVSAVTGLSLALGLDWDSDSISRASTLVKLEAPASQSDLTRLDIDVVTKLTKDCAAGLGYSL